MDEMVGNPKYITTITVDNKPINPSDISPNGGGIDLPNTNKDIKLTVTPGSERPIFKIEFPNDDNIKEVKIVLKPVDDKKTPEVIITDKPNEPIYPNSPENIKEIIITVISTTDGKKPQDIEVSVESCSPEATTITTTLTTGTGSTTTTSSTSTTTGTGSTTTTSTSKGTGSTTTTTPTPSTSTAPTSTPALTTIKGNYIF